MALMRLRCVVFVISLSLIACVGGSVWAYRIILSAGSKGDAETLLFLGIMASAIEATALLLLILDSRRKSKELDALTELVRYGGDVENSRLERFGSLGLQLRAILKELSDSSARKSVRIASLTGLLRAVMDMVERPIMIIGLDGRIVASSRGIADNEAFADLRTGESKIGDLVAGIDLRAIFSEADRTHSAVEREGSMNFIPVYSVQGEISHFLLDLSKRGAMGAISSFMQGKEGFRRKAHEAAPGRHQKGGFLGALRKRLMRPETKA